MWNSWNPFCNLSVSPLLPLSFSSFLSSVYTVTRKYVARKEIIKPCFSFFKMCVIYLWLYALIIYEWVLRNSFILINKLCFFLFLKLTLKIELFHKKGMVLGYKLQNKFVLDFKIIPGRNDAFYSIKNMVIYYLFF